MFPIWFLFLFPITWLIIIPANFLVDSLVLIFTLKYLQYADIKSLWKTKIWPVWGFGFLADMLGAGLVISIYLTLVELSPDLGASLIFFPGTCLVAIPGILLAGILIYFLNKKITFKKADLTPQQLHKLCLSLAIITAPYTMLIPLYW